MTVLELKNVVIREAGVRDHFEFTRLSPAHKEIWRHLNKLGSRGFPPWGSDDFPPDVDAAANVTDGEVEGVMEQFRAAQAGIER